MRLGKQALRANLLFSRSWPLGMTLWRHILLALEAVYQHEEVNVSDKKGHLKRSHMMRVTVMVVKYSGAI